jgi:protocatechuate 3,4-dioxygenase, alpha subunit
MEQSKLPQTPSQTIGPYFAYGLTAVQYGYGFSSVIDNTIVNETAEQDIIYITGNVYDGMGNTIHDAMIELWQADAAGNYVKNYEQDLPFKGLGRYGTGTDAQHRFVFKTVKPGAAAGQAPHIHLMVFMRGSLHVLYTRFYFEGDPANENDPLLLSVEPQRRTTLVAVKTNNTQQQEYCFNIYMQGEKETVFFDL